MEEEKRIEAPEEEEMLPAPERQLDLPNPQDEIRLPAPKRKFPLSFLILIVLIVLLILGVGANYLLSDQKAVPSTPQDTSTNIKPSPMVTTTTTKTFIVPADWKTFTDPTRSYSVRYPADVWSWDSESCKYSDPENKYVSSFMFTPTFITDCYKGTGPNKDYQKYFRLYISVEENPNHLSTNDVIRQATKAYKEDMNTNHPNYLSENRSIDEIMAGLKHIPVGGVDGITYPMTCSNCEGEYFKVANGSKIYNFTIVGDDGGLPLPKTLEKVHQILLTFQFIDSTSSAILN